MTLQLTNVGIKGFTKDNLANKDYLISKSLRFNVDDAAYFTRTFGTPTTSDVWTFSVWLKRGSFNGLNQTIFCSSGASRTYFRFNTSHELEFVYSGSIARTTVQLFRDTSSWYHLFAIFDQSQSAVNQLKIYINGIGPVAVTGAASINTSVSIGEAIQHQIGRNDSTLNYYDGLMSELYFIDGQNLSPTDFGQFHKSTNEWVPIRYSGTYGNNGFKLDFSDSTNTTTIGNDVSGNGNNWTSSGHSVSSGEGNDILLDTPTNNYPVFNERELGTPIISNGNLRTGPYSAASYRTTPATIALPLTGKWYWEINSITGTTSTGGGATGIMNDNATRLSYMGSDANAWSYYQNGNKYNNNSPVAYGSTWTVGVTIGVAYDADSGKIWFSHTNTWQASGDPVAGTNPAFTVATGIQYWPACSVYNNASMAFNFGQQGLTYTPPTGYKILNTGNLPDPILNDGRKQNQALSYTGVSGTTNNVTKFDPDFLYFKSTGAVASYWYDSLRSENLPLLGTTAIEGAATSGLSMDPQGWTLPGNTTGISTTGGIFHSFAMRKIDQGFTIVSFTGDGTTNRLINHDLNTSPQLVILRRRDAAASWRMWHMNMATVDTYRVLDTSTAETNTTSPWGTGSWTSTQFMVNGTLGNVSGALYVAYLFSSLDGVIKIGTYTGNAAADGPMVYTGFRPSFIFGAANTTVAPYSVDSSIETNEINPLSFMMNATADSSFGGTLDLLSNGFKIRSTTTGLNNTGIAIRYIAFSESPLKYSRAR